MECDELISGNNLGTLKGLGRAGDVGVSARSEGSAIREEGLSGSRAALDQLVVDKSKGSTSLITHPYKFAGKYGGRAGRSRVGIGMGEENVKKTEVGEKTSCMTESIPSTPFLSAWDAADAKKGADESKSFNEENWSTRGGCIKPNKDGSGDGGSDDDYEFFDFLQPVDIGKPAVSSSVASSSSSTAEDADTNSPSPSSSSSSLSSCVKPMAQSTVTTEAEMVPPSSCDSVESWLSGWAAAQQDNNEFVASGVGGRGDGGFWLPDDCNTEKDAWAKLSEVPSGVAPRVVPESGDGEIEYKFKIDPNGHRFQRLVTQLNYRLLEGCGRATYLLGVMDDGTLAGQARGDILRSMDNLRRMARELGAAASLVVAFASPEASPYECGVRRGHGIDGEGVGGKGAKVGKWELMEDCGDTLMVPGGERNAMASWVVEMEVRRFSSNTGGAAGRIIVPGAGTGNVEEGRSMGLDALRGGAEEGGDFVEMRVAVCGGVAAGKTTLLAVLSTGQLDGGNGQSRTLLFKHRHEIMSGQTSSMVVERLGYDHAGKLINHQGFGVEVDETGIRATGGGVSNLLYRPTTSEVVARACYLVCLSDLPGSDKYRKTLLCGMTQPRPHLCLVVIAADEGVTAQTRTHLGLAAHLGLEVVFAISKSDLANGARQTALLSDVIAAAAAVGRRAVVAGTGGAGAYGDGVETCDKMDCPIFVLSSLTGYGVDEFQEHLAAVAKRLGARQERERAAKSSLATEREIKQGNSPTGSGCGIKCGGRGLFVIDSIYQDIAGTCVVVGGFLRRGQMRVGMKVEVGPRWHEGESNGRKGDWILLATIESIHTHHLPVACVEGAKQCSFALRGVPGKGGRGLAEHVAKGMVLVEACEEQGELDDVEVDSKLDWAGSKPKRWEGWEEEAGLCVTVGVEMTILNGCIGGRRRFAALIWTGGGRQPVGVHLLDKGGETGLGKAAGSMVCATLNLDGPLVVERGEKVVIRNGSFLAVGRVVETKTLAEESNGRWGNHGTLGDHGRGSDSLV